MFAEHRRIRGFAIDAFLTTIFTMNERQNVIDDFTQMTSEAHRVMYTI